MIPLFFLQSPSALKDNDYKSCSYDKTNNETGQIKAKNTTHTGMPDVF